MDNSTFNIILIVFIIIQTIVMIMSYKKQTTVKKVESQPSKQNGGESDEWMVMLLWLLLAIPGTLLIFVVPKLLTDNMNIYLPIAILGIPVLLTLPAGLAGVIYRKIKSGK